MNENFGYFTRDVDTHHGNPRGDVNGVDVVAEDEGVEGFTAADDRWWQPLDALRHFGQTFCRKIVEVFDRLD